MHDCKKVFSTPRKRRLHLIDKHKYPGYFPFDLVYTGTLSFEERKIRDEKNKARLRRLSMDQYKNNKVKDMEMESTNDESTQDVDMDELITNMSKLRIPKSISFGHTAGLGVPQHRHHEPQHRHHEPLLEKKPVKVYPHPRKRGPKKKKPAVEPMVE